MTNELILSNRGGHFGSLDDVVRAYRQWLELKAPEHAKAFTQRLGSDPEAARGEAVVFSLLRSRGFAPFPAEDLSTGGADFLCHGNLSHGPVVEVSALRGDAVAQRSGLPKDIDTNTKGHWFSMITAVLWTKVSGKAGQLAGQTGSRVLAITLEHAYADFLMGAMAAKWLMCGESKISVPIEPTPGDVREVTHLNESAFFRFTKSGEIESCRRSISAILLIGVEKDCSRVIGLLHPDPVVPLEYSAFFPIPFLAVTNWPIRRDDSIKTEWRMPEQDPDPHPFIHEPPWFTNKELYEP
jgi:hypothetical protein